MFSSFTCRYTGQQLLAVVLLTCGALAVTAAEALVGDTAAAAAAKRALSESASVNGTDGSGIVSGSPCMGEGCGNAAAAGAAVAGGAPARAAAAVASAVARVLASGSAPGGDGGDDASSGSSAYMLRWGIGMLILVLVLVLQTLLGNYQNWAAGTYGRAPQEGMFWSHTLSLPMFALAASDLASRGRAWAATPPLAQYLLETFPALGQPLSTAAASSSGTFGLLGLRLAQFAAVPLTHGPLAGLPLMWALVLANAVSQFVCVTGVYALTSVSDPLTVNVTLTVRKCVSLLLSIWAFGNTFTPAHWLGAGLVFGGALLYGLDLGGGGAKGTVSGPPAAAKGVGRAGGLPCFRRRKEKGDDDATRGATAMRMATRSASGGGVSGSGRVSYYGTTRSTTGRGR